MQSKVEKKLSKKTVSKKRRIGGEKKRDSKTKFEKKFEKNSKN